MVNIKNIIGCLSFCFLMPVCSNAQQTSISADTLQLGIDSADRMFLQNNLQLLAQKYNISAQQALEAQAKLYPNPNIQISTALYNQNAKQWLPFGNNGEVSAQLTQEILLAGKRSKQVQLAVANTQLTQAQFIRLLETLKYTLHTDFYTVYYLQKSAAVYTGEINSLQILTDGFDKQLAQGYVSQKDALRIKAQLYSLQSEYNDLINQINDIQSEMRIILHHAAIYVRPQVDEQWANALDPNKYPLQTLVDSALANHPDLKVAKLNTRINELNYRYQKSLAVPDLSLNLGYDQQGSYVHNFTSVGIGIDLPFFNRNQGNIRSAKYLVSMAQAQEDDTKATVEENIYNQLVKVNTYDALYRKRDPKFDSDFTQLQQATFDNYRARNIGLLDFLDFYDSYKNNMLQINALQINRMTAFEAINYYTGSNFF